MKFLLIDGAAHGEEHDLNTPILSYFIVNRAGGSGPGGQQRHRYEPTELTPEVAQRGFTNAFAYVGVEPE